MKVARALLGLMVIALTVAVAGCGGDDESSSGDQGATGAQLDKMQQTLERDLPGVPTSLLRAACKEGEVQAYELSLPNIQEFNNAFEKRFPCIKVEFIEASGGTLITRLRADAASGNVPDIVQLSNVAEGNNLADQGLLAKHTPALADELDTDRPGLWYPYAEIGVGIGYNTDVVSDQMMQGVKKWSDLSTLVTPEFSDVGFGISSSFDGPSGVSFFSWHTIAELGGEDTVRRLFENSSVRGYDGTGPAVDALTAGEIGVFIGGESNVLAAVTAKAPVKMIYPAPFTQTPLAQAIPANAPHPDAAKLFHEWTFSEAGQRVLNECCQILSPLRSVPDVRAVAKQPWWSIPEERYAFDVEALTKEYDSLNQLYDSLPHG